MFKIDLHVHTTLGGDSLIEPADIANLGREAGLDAVCVTEHHSYAVSQPIDQIALDAQFPIFRGFEYSAEEGHLLIFGVKAGRGDLMPRLPMQRVVTWVNNRGGVAVAAHPYQRSMMGGFLGDDVYGLQELTAVEGVNGSAAPDENKKALEAARELGLPATGGSDAHGPIALGQAYTVFSEQFDGDDGLVHALKAGRFYPCWEINRNPTDELFQRLTPAPEFHESRCQN